MSDMNRSRRCLLVIAALFIVGPTPNAAAQAANPLTGLERSTFGRNEGLEESAGLAVGIVKGDSVVFAKGFGVRTVGQTEPVDTHTMFALASDSKQFTGILLAMLADDGKVRWDALHDVSADHQVRRRLPDEHAHAARRADAPKRTRAR